MNNQTGIKKVTQKDLDNLKTEMPYRWRVQTAKHGKAIMVAYVDSRQVQDKLDECVGASNWRDEYRVIDDNLFCGVSIKIGDEWVTKWDVGTESQVEKEKGNSSDSFKRAAVKWQVARYIYSLGTITLPTKQYGSKEHPVDDKGQILWGGDAITDYCNKVYKKGELDLTRVKPSQTVTSRELPYLNKSDSSYPKVTEALQNGTATIDDVKSKFRLSRAIEKELLGLIK